MLDGLLESRINFHIYISIIKSIIALNPVTNLTATLLAFLPLVKDKKCAGGD